MIFSIEAKNLHAALKAVGDVIEARSTLPILKNVKLSVSEADGLILTATDGDSEAKMVCDVLSCSAAGSVTVEARALTRFVSALPPGDVDMTLKDDGLHVVSRRTRAILPTLPVSDFAEIGFEPSEASMVFEAKALRAGLEAVEPAQGNEQARYYLCGVYFEPSAGGLDLTATNGHRLMTYRLDTDQDPTLSAVTLPTKLVKSLIGLLGRYKAQTVTISHDGNRLRAVCGPETLTGKLIDGTFPDWRRVLPSAEGRCKISVLPAGFSQAVGAVMSYCDAKQPAVTLRIRVDGIDIQADDLNVRAQTAVDCEAGFDTEDQVLVVGIKSGYLQQALGALPPSGGELYLEPDAAAPILFLGDGLALRQCIMPLRGNGWREL